MRYIFFVLIITAFFVVLGETSCDKSTALSESCCTVRAKV